MGKPPLPGRRRERTSGFGKGPCKNFMTIALKSSHVERYKQIVRLLYKYGRGDMWQGAGLEDPGIEEPKPGDAPASAGPTVHPTPGEFLRRQREVDQSNGKAPATPSAAGEDEDARARDLADDLEAMGPTFIKLGQFLSTRGDM